MSVYLAHLRGGGMRGARRSSRGATCRAEEKRSGYNGSVFGTLKGGEACRLQHTACIGLTNFISLPQQRYARTKGLYGLWMCPRQRACRTLAC